MKIMKSTAIFWGNKEYDNFVDPTLRHTATALNHNIFEFNVRDVTAAQKIVMDWCENGTKEVFTDDEESDRR